jgi:hypothetical protein
MDWEGTRYFGLTLDWDYINSKVHLSMPGCIENALVRFGHEPPDKPQLHCNLILTQFPLMARQFSMPRQRTHHRLPPKPKRNTSDRSLEYCSTTASMSIPPSSRDSAHSPQPKPKPQHTPCPSSNGSSTTQQPIQTPS